MGTVLLDRVFGCWGDSQESLINAPRARMRRGHAPSGTAIKETGEQRPCPIIGGQEKEPCSWCDLTSALKGRSLPLNRVVQDI
jgi:hypothetical protein